MHLVSIQSAIQKAHLDGWLFYDHHHRDPIAYRVLKITPKMCTRRWYYLIPANGTPRKLVHAIEKNVLAGLPGVTHEYSSWAQQHEKLKDMLGGLRVVAMQYSPLNDIPYIGLVDAGTVELVKSFGVEVVSSGDLVQTFVARWSAEALRLHGEAIAVLQRIIHDSFRLIRDAIISGRAIREYDLHQQILTWYDEQGLESDSPPSVAVNAHSADPHYSSTPESDVLIQAGDFVLLDIWAKRKAPEAVYADITWSGYVGEPVPVQYQEVFGIVREARDRTVEFVRRALREGRHIRGYEADEVARRYITACGYGESYPHRTGHSLGEDPHGQGANLDNYETRDHRSLIPGTCFSVEPGIYLPGRFGVRTEVNVYLEEHDARVTGDSQQAIIGILK